MYLVQRDQKKAQQNILYSQVENGVTERTRLSVLREDDDDAEDGDDDEIGSAFKGKAD